MAILACLTAQSPSLIRRARRLNLDNLLFGDRVGWKPKQFGNGFVIESRRLVELSSRIKGLIAALRTMRVPRRRPAAPFHPEALAQP